MNFIKHIFKLKYLKKAKDLLKDPKNLSKKIDMSYKKLKDGNLVKEEKNKLTSLILLIKDYISGDYKDISKKTIIYIIGAVLYFLNPLDLIPDMILAIGFIDDLSILSFVYKKVSNEISQYQDWKRKDSFLKNIINKKKDILIISSPEIVDSFLLNQNILKEYSLTCLWVEEEYLESIDSYIYPVTREYSEPIQSKDVVIISLNAQQYVHSYLKDKEIQYDDIFIWEEDIPKSKQTPNLIKERRKNNL